MLDFEALLGENVIEPEFVFWVEDKCATYLEDFSEFLMIQPRGVDKVCLSWMDDDEDMEYTLVIDENTHEGVFKENDYGEDYVKRYNLDMEDDEQWEWIAERLAEIY